jgi:hypothetical protein
VEVKKEFWRLKNSLGRVKTNFVEVETEEMPSKNNL